MDKSIIANMEQLRAYDLVSFEHDVQQGLGWFMQDILSAMPTGSIVAGLTPKQSSPLSLSFTVSAGRIYTIAANDATATGAIPQDLTQECQQGLNAGQTLTLVPPSAGQSQWNLVQGQFQQSDQVRAGDPNSGIVPFYNAANPTQPIPTSINTVRRGLFVLQVIQGSAVTTGSEVPPNPTAGWTPLYLVDLTGGQTTIQNSQITVAGPSSGTGVPTNYPQAPFLAGFLVSHHSGGVGQAPKIKLGSEVQGTLPYANMSPVRTLLSGNLTLYVNPTGSDNNNGMSASTPFLTIQAAVNAVYRNYDFNGYSPTISLANGTYTTGAHIVGLPVGIGAGSILSIVGNASSPSSVVWNVTDSYCLFAQLGANVSVSGMTVEASGGGPGQGIALWAAQSSYIQHFNIIFGACGSYHLVGQDGGGIYLTGGTTSYSITGGAFAHMYADSNGLCACNGANVAISGTPAFSVAFALSTNSGTLQATSSSYTGSVTGTRFNTEMNGTILTGSGGSATYFPGSATGTTSLGGQYN